MADNLTKEQRSKTMSKIQSSGTKQEKLVHAWMKKNAMRHKMHPKIEGSPDLIIPEKKTAVFLHGCFWHACKKCFVKPKTNIKYWLEKISKTVERDKRNKKALTRKDWKVIVIWEHQIKHDLVGACRKLTK